MTIFSLAGIFWQPIRSREKQLNHLKTTTNGRKAVWVKVGSEEIFLAKRTAEYKGYLVNRGYPSKLVDDQFSKASAISRNDLLRTRGKEAKKLFPFVLTFNPNLPNVGNIIRKHLLILQSNPKLKELFPLGSIIPSFRRSKNLKELLAPSRFKIAEEGQTIQQSNGCFKCERNRCHLCRNFFVESKSFLSLQTGKNTTFIEDFLVVLKM